MRGFTQPLTSITPSYENAKYAGSLSPTGNSFRPIGAPVKRVSGSLADLVQPSSYPAPRANPVKGVQNINRFNFSIPRANPVHVVGAPIRGIIGS